MTNLRERLIQAGFAVNLEPGTYNLIYTADNAVENGLWPSQFEPELEEEGRIALPNGEIIDLPSYNRYSELLDSAQLQGYSHGFHHGVALRTDEELGEQDLDFLQRHGLIGGRIELDSAALLVSPQALAEATHYYQSPLSEEARELTEAYRNGEFSLRELGIDAEETSYALVLRDRVLDAYDAPGEILQLGELV